MSLLSQSDAESLEQIARSVALVRPDLGRVLRKVLTRLEETVECSECGLFDIGAKFAQGLCPHCLEDVRRGEQMEARGEHL